jgi:secreted PhoX family phosphatase
MYRRREFVRTGLLGAGVLTFGPAFWRSVLAAPGTPGPGPYGPLGPPDGNGFRLPAGFSSRLIARGGQPVAGTGYKWHIFSDGAATFARPGGGWILVSNCEAPAFVGGGAGAIRFDARGGIVDAYRILGGTNTNCAGGATPWGTWLSCEEFDRGRVWECDPRGTRAAVVRPALGVFKHEAVAVDRHRRRVYLTEDEGDGGFYRFTPRRWRDLRRGRLDIAIVQPDGTIKWTPVPDPAALSTPTRYQVPGSTVFQRGEGIWYDSHTVYVATTRDNRIHAYDTRKNTIEVIYDARAHADPPLTGVDNVTASHSGDLYVCEDNGDDELDLGLITPDHEIARFLTATGPGHRNSELAGAVFNPAGSRLYLASQRYLNAGAIFEIRGPFRRQRSHRPA